jgi:isopentenyl diphosphate isomerase/L-lactate dehydrogenase-like FMN-dependent dehydrogenase
VKSTGIDLLGKHYDQPFGIAPIGLCNLVWPDLDDALFALARDKNIPAVLSTAGSASIEDAAKLAGDKLWFQLYLSREERITADLLKRAWDAGVRVLAFTVDVPGPARRNAALRAGFTTALTWNGKLGVDIALHPSWSLSTLMKGSPKLGNFGPYGDSMNQSIAQVSRGNGLTWDDLKLVRNLWKGKLVIKGVLEPDDARKMIREGVDGIWVSNHGGRQLEASPATIDVLASIRAAVGPNIPVMIDSGIRSGEDVLKCLGLGADFVFCGRSFLYGAAAFGPKGVLCAYNILAAEVQAGLMQMGCPSAEDLDESYILKGPGMPSTRLVADPFPVERLAKPNAAE